MLVKERMSHPVITIEPTVPIMEAHELMRQEHIRRLFDSAAATRPQASR